MNGTVFVNSDGMLVGVFGVVCDDHSKVVRMNGLVDVIIGVSVHFDQGVDLLLANPFVELHMHSPVGLMLMIAFIIGVMYTQKRMEYNIVGA